jgi:hypothetical protein
MDLPLSPKHDSERYLWRLILPIAPGPGSFVFRTRHLFNSDVEEVRMAIGLRGVLALDDTGIEGGENGVEKETETMAGLTGL